MALTLLALTTTVLTAFTQPAFAQTTSPDMYRMFPVLECPAVGEEYEKMISHLEEIKTSIKNDANCDRVTNKVKSLEDLVVKDREKVKQAVDDATASGTPLTEGQAQMVRDYAEEITKKVAALNDLFLGANYCFREDQADQQLASIAGFVGEAAQLIGSVSGPWGAPIALGGNIIAGFLTGMDQVLKSRAGYDFSKREQWFSYVQNLCTYHNYRDQIAHLLDPQARVSELQSFKDSIVMQIHAIEDKCPECRAIEFAYNSQKDNDAAHIRQLLTQEVNAANSRFKDYGNYTLQNLGLRDWVISEIARVQREAQSYWSDVSGRNLLYRAKKQIEDFLITREAPRFLTYQAKQAQTDYNEFVNSADQRGREIYYTIYSLNKEAVTSPVRSYWSDKLDYFRSLIISPIRFELLPNIEDSQETKYSWLNYRDQSLEQLSAADTSTQVVLSFCSFFRNAGQYSPSIKAACRNSSFVRLNSDQSKLLKELADANINIHHSGSSTPQSPANPQELEGNSGTPQVFLTRLQALKQSLASQAELLNIWK